MNRPAGITLSAILLFLMATLQLLGLAFLVLAAIGYAAGSASVPSSNPAMPVPTIPVAPVLGLMHVFFLFMTVFCLLLVVWTAATGIGLLRLRNWARISLLIFAGCLAAYCLFSIFGLVMTYFLAPSIPGQAAQLTVLMHVFLAIGALFYAVLMGIGICWLIYFNRRATKAYFTPQTAHWATIPSTSDPQLDPYAPQPTLAPPPARSSQFPPAPLAISILGWLWLVSSALCLLCMLIPMPAFFLGFLLTGFSKDALYLTFAALGAYLGWGLLHLRETARRIAIAFLGLGIVQMLLMLVPAYSRRLITYSDDLTRSMTLTMPTMPQNSPIQPTETYFLVARIHTFSILFGAVLGLAINLYVLWLLHHNRKAFQPSTPAVVEA